MEIDGQRYPKNDVNLQVSGNDFSDHYRVAKLFYREKIGRGLFIFSVPYPDMKNVNPVQVNDIRHQLDHLTPKKIQLFEEYRADPAYARIYVILIRHREMKMVSDRNKIIRDWSYVKRRKYLLPEITWKNKNQKRILWMIVICKEFITTNFIQQIPK